MIIGKICCMASKKRVISSWIPQKREFAVGHHKKHVISSWTLRCYFIISYRFGERNTK
jgi:hypothetical protein